MGNGLVSKGLIKKLPVQARNAGKNGAKCNWTEERQEFAIPTNKNRKSGENLEQNEFSRANQWSVGEGKSGKNNRLEKGFWGVRNK